ncbi:MAG: tetratricopeptide repeat protein [Planctomycetes bacterium]|nr:tetratricopeptide repeat protein [Planctomycetota bacterium]
MSLFRKIEPRKQIHVVIAQINAGDHLAALRTCEKLLERAPRHAEASRLMGQICEKLGNDRKAATHYRVAMEVSPNYANLRAFGHVSRRLGDLDAAVDAFEKAHEIDGHSAEIMTALAEIYEERAFWPKAVGMRKSLSDRNPDDLDALYELARCTCRAKLVQEAVILCTRLLNKNPEHPRGLRLLADCMLSRNQLDRALELYQQALKARPEDWEGHLQLARIYVSLGRNEDAIPHFQGCVRYQSGHPDAHRGLVNLYKESRRWLEAEIVLKHLLIQQGESPEILEELGDLAHAQSEYDQAVTLYQQARNARPGGADLDAKYVTALLHAGRGDQALDLARRLVSHHAFHFHYLYLYTLCLLASGGRAKALETVKEITVSPAQHAELFKLRAKLLGEAGASSQPAASLP